MRSGCRTHLTIPRVTLSVLSRKYDSAVNRKKVRRPTSRGRDGNLETLSHPKSPPGEDSVSTFSVSPVSGVSVSHYMSYL